MQKLKILLTGSEGFIGNAIAGILIDSNIDFIGVDRRIPKISSREFLLFDLNSGDLDALLESQSPDVVIHCAAQSDVEESIKHAALDAEINIISTIALLESFVKTKGTHFIYLQSGGAIYDYSGDFPIKEDHPVKPISPYGLSKLTSESYVQLLCENAGIGWTSLALSNCYGPVTQNQKGVIYEFWEKISKGECPTIYGPEVTRDFIHINDVVNALMTIISTPLNTRINIASGTEISLEELFRLVSEVLEVDVKPIIKEPIKGQIMRSALSNEKARQLTGWTPTIDIRTGIEMMSDE